MQPESIINLQTIQNSIAPTADHAMIAALSPSVTNFSTNGPGLNESKPTLRGYFLTVSAEILIAARGRRDPARAFAPVFLRDGGGS